MSGCCGPGDLDDFFSPRRAQDKARRYLREGLNPEGRRILELLRHRGLQGSSVLEVGGGIGALALELVRGGAARATNVELSRSYEPVAADLISRAGLSGRIDRRVGDIVAEGDAIPAADVVILQRVVCCYPDAKGLVEAGARRAKRELVLTLPVDRWWFGIPVTIANLWLRLSGSKFRAFVHPTRVVVASAQRAGLQLDQRRVGLIWQMLVFARTG